MLRLYQFLETSSIISFSRALLESHLHDSAEPKSSNSPNFDQLTSNEFKIAFLPQAAQPSNAATKRCLRIGRVSHQRLNGGERSLPSLIYARLLLPDPGCSPPPIPRYIASHDDTQADQLPPLETCVYSTRRLLIPIQLVILVWVCSSWGPGC